MSNLQLFTEPGGDGGGSGEGDGAGTGGDPGSNSNTRLSQVIQVKRLGIISVSVLITTWVIPAA